MMKSESSPIDHGWFEPEYLDERWIELETELADVSYELTQLYRKLNKIEESEKVDFRTVVEGLGKLGRELGKREYGNEVEIEDGPTRDLIFDLGVKMGFIKREIIKPAEGSVTERLKISSEFPEEAEVAEAVVVPGAAGISNLRRVAHAMKGIGSGKIVTDRLILVAGERPVGKTAEPGVMPEYEKPLEVGFRSGDSEYELMKLAVEDLLEEEVEGRGAIEWRTETKEVEFGGQKYPFEVLEAEVEIDGKKIKTQIVNAPYDPQRVLPGGEGKLATRSTTEETFQATLEVLGDFDPSKKLYLVSHDMWQIAQLEVAREIFGEKAGREVVGTGPANYEPEGGRKYEEVGKNEAGETRLRLVGFDSGKTYSGVLADVTKYLDRMTRTEKRVEKRIGDLDAGLKGKIEQNLRGEEV